MSEPYAHPALFDFADAINENQRQRGRGVPFLSKPYTYSIGDLPACPICKTVPRRIRVGAPGDVVSFRASPTPVTLQPCGHLFSIAVDEMELLLGHEEERRRMRERPMRSPCTRPECGGEIHTDPWGVPVQCPHIDAADTGRRCPRCDCPDGHTQCEHCKVCPHARQAGASVTTEQQARPLTTDEQLRMLFDRTAKLNDAMSALLAPEWGARMGIIPEGHPLHPGADEQGVPIDWQAIAKQRERELKKAEEARHRAEQAIARVRDVIAERRTEVTEREEDGILPFGTPGASWCDAVTVTCARVEDALRARTEPIGIPANSEQEEPS